MLIEQIKEHDILSKYIIPRCEENNICVEIDQEIDSEDVLIIKVDAYYNSLRIARRPPSPDCMIILKCQNEEYLLTIAELKAIDSDSRFDLNNMFAKFDTCINDFITVQFADVLDIDYKKINLFFVSRIEIYKRDAALKMKVLQNRPYTFHGKRFYIQPKMPTPAIKPCKTEHQLS